VLTDHVGSAALPFFTIAATVMSDAPHSHERRETRIVYVAALFALTLWGGTPIANKIAVAEIDPATAGLLRSAVAGLLCALLAWGLKLPFPRTGRHRTLLLTSGIASFAAWPALLSTGLGLTTANHAALLIATIPIFTGLMAAAVDRIRPGSAWLLGVTIALGGTFLLIASRGGAAAGVGGNVTGDLFIFVGVLACAAGYVAGGKLAPTLGTVATTFWSLAVASILLVPALLWRWPRTDWAAIGLGSWAAVGYMALCSSLLGYLAWFWALGRGGIARISAWQLGQPVLTVILAALLLGERLTLPLVAAGLAVLGGTALTQLRASR
jgi:drug/metabolite transporter (DMT)-like permease